MDKTLNIIGDCHNFDSLKNILEKYDNVLFLGDISAILEKKEFCDNLEDYRIAWKAFANNDFSNLSLDKKYWFERINVQGFVRQLDTIRQSKKRMVLNMGNADFSIIRFFPRCKGYLEDLEKDSGFRMIKSPDIQNIDNIQIIFLPYSQYVFDLQKILDKIDENKPLYVIAHCPAFEYSKKTYYVNHYKAIKEISSKYKNRFFYIHGHIHPNLSYIYTLSNIPNVTVLTPKADENLTGININHDIIQIDTEDNIMRLLDNNTDEYIEFNDLPIEYLSKENHWNDFEK